MIRTVWYAHSKLIHSINFRIDIKMTRTPDYSYSKKYLTQKFFESQKTRSSKNVPRIRKFALILELPVAFNLDIPYNLGYVTYFFKWIANVSEVRAKVSHLSKKTRDRDFEPLWKWAISISHAYDFTWDMSPSITFWAISPYPPYQCTKYAIFSDFSEYFS